MNNVRFQIPYTKTFSPLSRARIKREAVTDSSRNAMMILSGSWYQNESLN
jgi:hypothetical protein